MGYLAGFLGGFYPKKNLPGFSGYLPRYPNHDKKYLVVSTTVQNMVGIGGAVCIIWHPKVQGVPLCHERDYKQ